MNKLIDSFLLTDFDDSEFIANIYNVVTVSYFDHYLNEDEYSTIELVCYSDIKGDFDRERKFKKIENKFIKLYDLLFNLSGEQVVICIEGKLYKPLSYEEYNLFIINAVKEKPLCQILYPTLMVFSVTSYDLTHHFFFLKNSAISISIQENMENLVNTSGLNII